MTKRNTTIAALALATATAVVLSGCTSFPQRGGGWKGYKEPWMTNTQPRYIWTNDTFHVPELPPMPQVERSHAISLATIVVEDTPVAPRQLTITSTHVGQFQSSQNLSTWSNTGTQTNRITIESPQFIRQRVDSWPVKLAWDASAASNVNYRIYVQRAGSTNIYVGECGTNLSVTVPVTLPVQSVSFQVDCYYTANGIASEKTGVLTVSPNPVRLSWN